MKNKKIIAGLTALLLTASLSVYVSAENTDEEPEYGTSEGQTISESAEDVAIPSYGAYQSSDYTYEFIDLNTAVRITAYTGNGTSVSIPSEIDGKPVTELSEELFYKNTDIIDVKVGANVKELPESCFEGCTKLTNVSLPEGLKTIGCLAFNGCTSLKSITIPSTVTKIAGRYNSGGVFEKCTALTEVIFKEGTEPASIGAGAFYNTGITSLVLPSNYTSLGEDAFSQNKDLKTVEIKGKVETLPDFCFEKCTALESVILPEGLKTIDRLAFFSCTSLKSITIPSTVTKIAGRYNSGGVFEKCTALTEVIFKEGTEPASIGAGAFYNTGITSLVLPANYTSLGEDAFSQNKALKTVEIKGKVEILPDFCFEKCTALESVILPEGLKTIDRLAFFSCTSLKSITIPSTVTKIAGRYNDGGVFEDCTALTVVTFKEGTEPASIGAGAFYNTGITSLVLPANYTTLGEESFSHNKNLKTVEIKGKVEILPEGCFEKCTALESVILPEGLKTIERMAFNDCSSLPSITIPSTVTEIGDFRSNTGVFEDCSSLVKVTFKEGNEPASIGNRAFYNTGITSLVLPVNYTSLGEEVFSRNKNLKTVEIKGKVETLPDFCFEGCTSLESVILPEGLKTIDRKAFFNCSSLKSITIPSTVTEIAGRYNYSGVFEKCTALTEVIFKEGTEPASIGDGAFYGTKLSNVHLPKNYVSIGEQAFSSCEDLILFNWDQGSTDASVDEKAFQDDEALEHIFLPDNVTSIGSRAFDGCKNASVALSEKTAFESDAFSSVPTRITYSVSDGKATVTAISSTAPKVLISCRLSGYPVNTGNNTSYTGEVVNGHVYCGNECFLCGAVNELSAFVDRLYTIILDRPAEEAGLADWTNALKSGENTSADIVYGLANSQEFNNKALSNDQIVERMYLAMLGRPSDEGGKADWLAAMANGCTVNGIINGFSGSQEFANICAGYGISAGSITNCEPRDKNVNLTAFVSRMYTKALNRAYDVDGLNDWTNDYLNGDATADKIAYGFILSQEFEGRNLSNEAYVDTLYRTFFDREPDEGGKAGWLDELANGTSRKDVLDGFLGAEEFANLKSSFGV